MLFTGKAVAFDMDGTLYSSEPIIEEVYALSVQRFNFNNRKKFAAPKFSEIEPLIGQPVLKIYQTLFLGITDSEIAELGGYISAHFEEAIDRKGGLLFSGVQELFGLLQQKKILVFIASNGKREYLEAILKKFGLHAEPLYCIGEEGINEKKDILLAYMRKYNLAQKDLLMVGDRSSDFEAARKAGTAFIGCNFGHGHLSEIAGADKIINELNEIKAILA